MKRILGVFIHNLLLYSLLKAHPLCVDTITRRDNNPTGTKVEGSLQYLGCPCSCQARRYGDKNRCITCNHRHYGDTSSNMTLSSLQQNNHTLITLVEHFAHLKKLTKLNFSR